MASRYENAREMPFNTRRSSALGTPRGLSGSSGSMIDHSPSVSSYCRQAIQASIAMKTLEPKACERTISSQPAAHAN
jgi:hypothetical protein